MNSYELVYILQPDLDETTLAALNERIQQVITTNGGKVVSSELMGKRTLAYPIKKRREGYYMLVKAAMTQNTITELERSLRLSEDVLRHMLVRIEEKQKPAAEDTTETAEQQS